MDMKVRVFDKIYNVLYYVRDLYFFEKQYIYNLNDFQQGRIPMICTNKCDNGGSEIWEGDTMTNGYVTVEIVYDDSKAAFMGKYTHIEDQYEYLWKLIKMGFLRIGNKYCKDF
ncbi:hypothetical protein BSK59_13610 [Paenibacillus odorifer]|uniref:hypothetical protein n=1 Tax=Paenibacillus odorifer TaxID=189426 RepID=UPI00096F5D89|nr:hypothetical protein [Paenibacillus odorifer]OME55508.1 hypothetical protein BSK59_13610 [Paenibacillus odorifer]